MPQAQANSILLHADDNVVIALQDIDVGDKTTPMNITLQEKVAGGHKIACKYVSQGTAVIRYGQIIGQARKNILPGEHVHVHNVKTKKW